MIEWNVSPEIITIGPITLRWYSMMFLLAFLLGLFIMRWIYNKEGFKAERVDQLFIYMFVSTIIGAPAGTRLERGTKSLYQLGRCHVHTPHTLIKIQKNI